MIAGYFSFQRTRLNSDAYYDTLSGAPLAEIPFSHIATWRYDQGFLIQQKHLSTSTASSDTQNKTLLTHPGSGTAISAWARIDNRQELIKSFAGEYQQLTHSDEGLILASYLKWGKNCCEYLIGDFAFAIYDSKKQQCFLGRDHTGVKPLYYYIDDKQLLFASSLAVFEQVTGLDLSLNQEWLSRYLIGRSQDWHQTAFNKIKKVEPAHTAVISLESGTIHTQPYFEFSYQSDLHLSNDDEYLEAYREVLNEAVRCRVQGSGLIGSELSGGLDSSSVTAIAARLIPNAQTRLHAFGVANHELEPDCIMSISQTSPIAMTHLSTRTQGHFAPISDFYESFGTPQEHGSALGHFPLYNACQNLGVQVLLSGFGGDEFTTSEAPTALVEFWRARQLGLFLSRQRGNWLTKPAHTARWLYHYYRFNNQSITARRLQNSGHLSWPLNPVKDELIEQYKLSDHFHEPLKYDGGQITQNGFALNNRWSPMMTTRFEHCTLMAARYGVDYRWPLMDIRLLKLFLSIPATQKLGPDMIGRYLHRRAVANVLPAEITWKKKDMVTVNLFKKLLKGDRYLQSLATPKRKANTKAAQAINANKPTVTTKPPELNQQLQILVEPEKLVKLQGSRQDPTLTEQQKRLCNHHLAQLNQLNQWLNFRDSQQLSDNQGT